MKRPCRGIERRYAASKTRTLFTIFLMALPVGCGHFEGLQDVLERFLTSFYAALDVHFIAEEFITGGENVVALGRIQGKTRKAAVPVNVPFAHVWTVRDGYLQRLRAFTDTAVIAHALKEN